MKPAKTLRLHRFSRMQVVRRYIHRDITPSKLLLLAAIAGAMIGTTTFLFESAVEYLTHLRVGFLHTLPESYRWIVAFFCSALLGGIGFYLVNRFAPEAGGSGIPEIEGALDDVRPVRWHRVLPVKFFGGTCALSSEMILGKEGPAVQMGGNIGKMVADICKLPSEGGHSLLAAGAAAGLATAFNAPLAGILFVLEELRPNFRYSFLSVKIVSTAVICGTIMRQLLGGTGPVFTLPSFDTPPLSALLLFLIFGCLMGMLGFIFNRAVNALQNGYLAVHHNRRVIFVATGAILAGIFGVLSLSGHGLTTGGMHYIPEWVSEPAPISWLFWLLAFRFIGTPGGVFAPLLALGTLCGALAGNLVHITLPSLDIAYGVFPIIGMGALFAASVRAPVTGIVLVVEMTNNYGLILPMMVATLSATLVAQMFGGKPIYTQILERTLGLARKAAIQARTQTPAETTSTPKES